MKYTKELEKDVVKFEISLSKEEWQEELDHAYVHTKNRYKVEGFRTGKAPRKVIEKAYGSAVFYDEAINHCFYEYYNEVLDKEPELELVGNPAVKVKDISDAKLVLTVTQTLKPQVTLGEYKGLNIEKSAVRVTAKEVEEKIKSVQEKSARMVVTENAVVNGNTVLMDFSGSLNGVKFDGGTATNFELEIGSGRFIPGFEEQIVGMKAGEEKDITVKFPEDYPAEELKGKDAVFAIKIHEVREKILPELNDEFAQNVSEFDTLGEYKEDIKKQIKIEKQQKADFEAEEKLIETISNNATVEIPEVMINEQIDDFIHDFEHRLAHQGLRLEDYLTYVNTNLADLKKSRRDDAIKTCKTRLTLEAIVKKENIKVEEDDLNKEIISLATYAKKDAEEFKKSLDEHQLSHIVNDILINKLLKFLKEANNL